MHVQMLQNCFLWPSFVLQPSLYAFLALKLLLGDELTYQITKSYAKNQIEFHYITNIKWHKPK